MVKADIVEKLGDLTGISKKECKEIIEDVFEIIKSNLATGQKVKIAGFGNFEVKSKAPRQGRNPQTGGAIMISARNIVSFKLSPVLKLRINGERND